MSFKTGIKVTQEKKEIFFDLDLGNIFEKFSQIVQNAISVFWEIDTKVKPIALSDYDTLKEEFIARDSDFFATQIKIENHKGAKIRLDSNFVEEFLTNSLEDSPYVFELSYLSELEKTILDKFCEFLYKRFNEVLTAPQAPKETEQNEKKYNFTFAVSDKKGFCSKIMISIPENRLKISKMEYTPAFKDEDFFTSQATVKIRAGFSRLTLDELQNLSCDDIIVLENSSSSYLTLISGELEKEFRVEVDKSLVIDLDSDVEISESNDENEINKNDNKNEVTMAKNLWDDIQIELSAEFSKVKMTIGELKQITKGQVVDLGSVFENEISLFVENKKVATGELLIINDKYAVKLNEVLSSQVTGEAETPPALEEQKEPKEQKVKVCEAEPTAKPQAPKEPKEQKVAANPKPKPAEDEEFDYSDFEN